MEGARWGWPGAHRGAATWGEGMNAFGQPNKRTLFVVGAGGAKEAG
jgi:hypothetical protein